MVKKVFGKLGTRSNDRSQRWATCGLFETLKRRDPGSKCTRASSPLAVRDGPPAGLSLLLGNALRPETAKKPAKPIRICVKRPRISSWLTLPGYTCLFSAHLTQDPTTMHSAPLDRSGYTFHVGCQERSWGRGPCDASGFLFSPGSTCFLHAKENTPSDSRWTRHPPRTTWGGLVSSFIKFVNVESPSWCCSRSKLVVVPNDVGSVEGIARSPHARP